MYEFFARIDRRWIFLLMLLAVTIPILLAWRFPEEPSAKVRTVFDSIEALPDGSVILMAFDYDPASQGELQPMASAFVRHAAENNHKMIFMTLWPQGGPMIPRAIRILETEYPHYQYGKDYVNLDFRPGNEGVIKVIVTNLRELYANDSYGTDLDKLPLTANMKNIQSVQMIVNVSAGKPGSKEWVQYAATPFDIPMLSGTVGVQAPALYPYIPEQLDGVLGAIKAAAEYEQTLIEAYPKFQDNPNAQEGLRRMGPQLVAHMLMIALIIAGNIIYFVGKKRGAAS
jgi:hypothetical protein